MDCDEGPLDALLAEAISCRNALQWLLKNSFQKVIVESDCLLLVSAVNSTANYLFVVGLIFKDCKELLQGLSESSLVFTHRSVSQAAHLLARAVGSRSGLVE